MQISRRSRIGALSFSSLLCSSHLTKQKTGQLWRKLFAPGRWRHQRLVNLAARRNAQRDVTPVDLLRERAEVLATRAANLKKLADAWQPLYASLDANQKDRLRFLAAYMLYEMRNAVETRRLQAEDEYYDETQE